MKSFINYTLVAALIVLFLTAQATAKSKVVSPLDSTNGVCGPASTLNASSSAPTTGLCSSGLPSPVTLAKGLWKWTCAGSDGGSSTSCTEQKFGYVYSTSNAVDGVVNVPQPNGCCGMTALVIGDSQTPVTLWLPLWWMPQIKVVAGEPNVVVVTDTHADGEVIKLRNVPAVYFASGSGGLYLPSLSPTPTSSPGTPPPVPTNGQCGTANGQNFSSTPSTNLCAVGSSSPVSGTGPWSWSCAGLNGGSAASCVANLAPIPVNGSCGPANGQALTSVPTSGLCVTGTSSAIIGDGPWSWTCLGLNGGTTSTCSATFLAPVNGSCGPANNVATLSAPSSGLCSAGSASSVSGTGPFSWSCAGMNDGTTASCSAPLEVSTNGACGTANGIAVATAPTSGLCSAGTSSGVAGAGPFTWSCAGTGAGSTASCTAPLLIPATNGMCGAANGVAVAAAPTAGLCSAGTATVVAGAGPFSWSCTGLGSGSSASCSAPLLPPVQTGPVLTAADAVNGVIDLTGYANRCSTGEIVTVQGNGVDTVLLGEEGSWPNQISRVNPTTVQVVDGHGCYDTAILINVPSAKFSDGAVLNISGVTAIWAVCGPANGAVFTQAPSTNLCTLGTATSVEGSGPWTWTCQGSGGGANAPCSATVPVAVNGACGPSAGQILAGLPTSGLCNAGNASSVAGGAGPWSWTCAGIYGGTTANCNAAPAPATAGICGYSNGADLNNAPLGGLCTIGSPSAVTGSGPWTWTCSGVNGAGASSPCVANPGPAVVGSVLAIGSYMSPLATAEQTQICSNVYPTQTDWAPAATVTQPRAATLADNLQPRIDQVRNGVVIATWQYFGPGVAGCSDPGDSNLNPEPVAASGCGIFGRSHTWQHWLPGDTFLVYPAVYNADSDPNQPYIGPVYADGDQYNTGIPSYPTDITILGVTVNGIRPVIMVDSNGGASDTTLGQGIIYIDHAVGLTIQNIDLDTTGVGDRSISRAGIYMIEGKDVTLRQMRIHGLQYADANGILATVRGTLTLDQVELYENGGVPDSYAHAAYISIEPTDPDYDPQATLHVVNSWSHNGFMGHLMKSRLPHNIIEGSYFEGGMPTYKGLAEDYDLDIPYGGTLIARNNVFTKSQSGYGENGISLAYGMEGIPDDRSLSIDIENNTFVDYALNYDDQGHPNYPFNFFYPAQIPGTIGFPVPNTIVKQNAFVGFCIRNQAVQDFRGDLAVSEAFSELNGDFSFNNKLLSPDTSSLGSIAYSHAAQPNATRSTTAIGAEN